MTTDSEDEHSRSSSAEDSGDEQGGEMAGNRETKSTAPQNGNTKSSLNAKDPLRPRRKKARRACFACQRAHLTCGDERPCQRCIKRGLQDQCQDGVRKKAKYLHDAPNEALMPGAANNLYNQTPGVNRNLALRSEPQPNSQNEQFFSPSTDQTYNVYQTAKSMPPPMMQDTTINPVSFSQPSPMSPSFSMNHGIPTPNISSSAQNTPGLQNTWNAPLFDPNDPTLFNFDLASMNFGNHYGALEFGMLGHMATGAGETPPSDGHGRGSVGSNFQTPVNGFTGSPGSATYGFGSEPIWPNNQPIYNQPYRPHGFAIETNPANFNSPDSNASPQAMINPKLEESPNMGGNAHFRPGTGTSQADSQNRSMQPIHPHPIISTPSLKASALPVKKTNRPRDPSQIYTSVTTPYSYTAGFHSLISFLQKRFASAPQKTLQIAKSLASIRPSFIATTKTLNRDDLIFMEKCFQRTLWEYEGFIEGIGTPTIIARRTGEIAAVGKEFSILTGWRKEVLLGKEPNLNVNRGASAAANSTLSSNRASGMSTPAQRNMVDMTGMDGEKTGNQPVFLAELLDDDSVIEFYEGFARLAFGDSRGSVTGKGKLLKYRTKEETMASSSNGHDINNGDSNKTKRFNGDSNTNDSETGTVRLRDSKVECTYCWTVKRDVFDIPMLIVMNFLPIF